MNEIECNKCGDICEVDGDYPKYFAWCDTCSDYAGGFDCDEYAADVLAGAIDTAKEERKYG